MGTECEVDAICDGEDFLIPGMMEHIERAGIHSGDSISVSYTHLGVSVCKDGPVFEGSVLYELD